MKKLATFVFALLLAGSLSFAQTGGGAGGATEKKGEPAAEGKKATKAHKGGKKGHKGGKKGKKSDAAAPAAAPK